MPFKNKAQVKALFAKDPALARKWAARYGLNFDELPTGPKRKPKTKVDEEPKAKKTKKRARAVNHRGPQD